MFAKEIEGDLPDLPLFRDLKPQEFFPN